MLGDAAISGYDCLEWGGEKSELPNINTPQKLRELYEKFTTYINNNVTPHLQPDIPGKKNASLLQCNDWQEWVTENRFLDPSWPFISTDGGVPINSGEAENEEYGWLNVLYAGGWATKITSGNPSVKSINPPTNTQ